MSDQYEEPGEGTSGSPSLLRNFLGLLTGRLVGDLATFLLFVVLSRHFGEEGIGQYSFATVIGGIALIVSDFGLRSYTLKEVGRHRDAARDRYWQIVASLLVNSVITFIVLVPVILLMPIASDSKAILVLICTSQLFLGIVSCAGVFFMAHERMEIAALFESLASWLVAVSAICVALADGSLVIVSLVIVTTYGIAAAVAACAAMRHFRIKPAGFSLTGHWRLLRETLPFALRQILSQISRRMDIVFIGLFLGPVEVGAYAVAYRLIFFLFVLFSLVGQAIVPASSKLFKEAHEQFLLLTQRALGVVLLIAVPAAVGLALVASETIELFFGLEFQTSIRLLQELAILIAAFPMASVMQCLMEAADRQVFTMYAEAVGVVTGLIAQCSLIPFFGLKGAVVAAILTEFSILVATAYGVRDMVDWMRLAGRLGIAILGSAAFALLYYLLPQVLPVVLILPAVAIYATVVLSFPCLRDEELSALTGLARKRTGGRAP